MKTELDESGATILLFDILELDDQVLVTLWVLLRYFGDDKPLFI